MRSSQLCGLYPNYPVRKPPSTQGPSEWKLLHEIFYCKSEVILEYEAKKLIEDIAVRPGWEEDEDEMLTGIVGYSLFHVGLAATIATSGMSLPGGCTKNQTRNISALESNVANVGSTILTQAKNSNSSKTQRRMDTGIRPEDCEPAAGNRQAVVQDC